MFLDIVSPLSHNLDRLVILHTVEFHRKYEAIHPEFNGSGMPLKHFIVHYTKRSESLSRRLLCTARNCSRGSRKNIRMAHSLSWPTHIVLAHTLLRSVPVVWAESTRLYMLPCVMPLRTVGYRQRSS